MLNIAERIEELAALAHPGGQPYIARDDLLDAALQPYDWYLDLVVQGAAQHCLPDEYLATLSTTSALPDPDPKRRTRVEALAILAGLEPSR